MTLVVSLSGVVTRVMPFQIPLPLMQIAIGALLAWPTFGLHVEFDPELFLVLFIPPLLFADGWKTPTREFLEHGREIFGLALALVVVTVVGIGFLIYWVVPGIPLIPAFALAAVAVIMLVLVFVPGIGVTNYGATRWIGFGAFTVQPSEIAKYAFVLFAAAHFSKHYGAARSIKGVVPVLALGVIFCLLIMIKHHFMSFSSYS